MTAADAHRAIEAVWQIESAKLIAGLARIVRDVGLAEELAQDALVAALEQWPGSGGRRSATRTFQPANVGRATVPETVRAAVRDGLDCGGGGAARALLPPGP
jgi:predicted RNA polymerase sigma factor